MGGVIMSLTFFKYLNTSSHTHTQKNQLLNGGHAADPQGGIPEPYNPYGVHTHHRTARGTVTTTTTVC